MAQWLSGSAAPLSRCAVEPLCLCVSEIEVLNCEQFLNRYFGG